MADLTKAEMQTAFDAEKAAMEAEMATLKAEKEAAELAAAEAKAEAEEAAAYNVNEAVDPTDLEAIKRANRRKSNEHLKNQRFSMKFLKDKDKYKDDVVVGVNGKLDLMQRGVNIQISGPAYAVLLNSEKQKSDTVDMISGLTQGFEEKNKQLN